MGSDLVPGLHTWDDGDDLVESINFIIFERKGFESILDKSHA